jgi:hypothetical protein
MTNKIEEVFTDIYVNRKWDEPNKSNESVSGNGSTLDYTKRLRQELPQLFDAFGIRRIFDAPCGDLNWMSHVLAKRPELDYTGGDIVQPLIDKLNVTYANNNVRFVKIDIINDPLPAAELMICRDCLFHFSEENIKLFLNNFVNSDIAALLTTSDTLPEPNRDIETGDYRHLNLFAEPYNFTPNYIYEINDWPYPTPPTRKMFMWSREQIKDVLEIMKDSK